MRHDDLVLFYTIMHYFKSADYEASSCRGLIKPPAKNFVKAPDEGKVFDPGIILIHEHKKIFPDWHKNNKNLYNW